MFDVDPALIDTPIEQEIVIDGEVKAIGSLMTLYDGMYAFLEEQTARSRPTQVAVEKPKLALFIRPGCPYCQKVLYFLSQHGKSIPLRDINESKWKDELLKKGGKKQVPCLFINDKPMYESRDIIEWLKANQDKY